MRNGRGSNGASTQALSAALRGDQGSLRQEPLSQPMLKDQMRRKTRKRKPSKVYEGKFGDTLRGKPSVGNVGVAPVLRH